MTDKMERLKRNCKTIVPLEHILFRMINSHMRTDPTLKIANYESKWELLFGYIMKSKPYLW